MSESHLSEWQRRERTPQDMVLQKGQVRSTHIHIYLNLDEAKGVCKDRSRWRFVISVYPWKKSVSLFIHACMLNIIYLLLIFYSKARPYKSHMAL